MPANEAFAELRKRYRKFLARNHNGNAVQKYEPEIEYLKLHIDVGPAGQTARGARRARLASEDEDDKDEHRQTDRQGRGEALDGVADATPVNGKALN